MMSFEELDEGTRRYMLVAFENEEACGSPYRGERLSEQGQAVFPECMRNAIKNGNELSLFGALHNVEFWHQSEQYARNGIVRFRRINMHQAAEQLSMSEFNTWYIRGLAKRLLDEGQTHCQVYRAAQPKWEPAECSSHEGQVFPTLEVYVGHRAKYWPKPGNPDAFSIPFNPGCHHTIRRIAQ